MNRPDPARVHYEGEQGREYHNEKRGVPTQAIPWIYQVRSPLFQSYLQADSKVLEYGCGAGWNLGGLKCREKVGHDISSEVREAVEASGSRFVDSLEALHSQQFNVIIAHHVLEHLLEPAAALLQLRDYLVPRGTLLLAVPYEKERRYRRFVPGEPNHHLYSWNVQTLCALVSTLGYTVHHAGIRRYGYDRFAARKAVQLRLGRPGFLALRRLLQSILNLQEVWVHAVRSDPER